MLLVLPFCLLPLLSSYSFLKDQGEGHHHREVFPSSHTERINRFSFAFTVFYIVTSLRGHPPLCLVLQLSVSVFPPLPGVSLWPHVVPCGQHLVHHWGSGNIWWIGPWFFSSSCSHPGFASGTGFWWARRKQGQTRRSIMSYSTCFIYFLF